MTQMLRLIVILIACGAVLGIALLISGRSRRVEEKGLGAQTDPKELMFRSTTISDGKTDKGVPFVDYRYKTSD